MYKNKREKTYDVLAYHIEKKLKEYHIQNKCVGAVTDNGSNFVKAFRMFSDDLTNEADQHIHR